jgi:hypothetical protein
LALDFTDFGTRFFDLFSSTAALDFSPAVISYKIRKITFFFNSKNRIERRSHLETSSPQLGHQRISPPRADLIQVVTRIPFPDLYFLREAPGAVYRLSMMTPLMQQQPQQPIKKIKKSKRITVKKNLICR